MASLVEGEVEDLTLVAYVIMHMLYLERVHIVSFEILYLRAFRCL